MRQLILWLDGIDWDAFLLQIIVPIVLITLFAFLLGGLGVSALICWCDPVREHGPILSMWAAVSLGGYAGLLVANRWDRIVAWAKRAPKIAPSSSGDSFEELARREVEKLLEENK